MEAVPLHPFVLRFGRVGDMVMLTSLLRLLHARYGGRCYVAGAGSWVRDVLHALPWVAACWQLPRHRPVVLGHTWLQVATALRRTAPGPIYVCEPGSEQLPRIRRLLALSGVDRRRILYLDDPAHSGLHWLDGLQGLGRLTPAALAAAAYPPPAGDFAPRLAVTDREHAQRHAWLAARGWTGRPLVLIQPGNHRSMGGHRRRWRRLNRDDKAWPLPRWAELAGMIHVRLPQALILLLGARTEAPMLEEIRSLSGVAAVHVASLPLRPTFALCSVAHSMISVDTGPAHAAAALGVPLVVLFGALPAREWGPRPAGAQVLPLGGPPHAWHVDQIEVQSVFAAWCRLQDTSALPCTMGPARTVLPLAGDSYVARKPRTARTIAT